MDLQLLWVSGGLGGGLLLGLGLDVTFHGASGTIGALNHIMGCLKMDGIHR